MAGSWVVNTLCAVALGTVAIAGLLAYRIHQNGQPPTPKSSKRAMDSNSSGKSEEDKTDNDAQPATSVIKEPMKKHKKNDTVIHESDSALQENIMAENQAVPSTLVSGQVAGKGAEEDKNSGSGGKTLSATTLGGPIEAGGRKDDLGLHCVHHSPARDGKMSFHDEIDSRSQTSLNCFEQEKYVAHDKFDAKGPTKEGQKASIKFQLRFEGPGPVIVVGSAQELGDWEPSFGVEMTRDSNQWVARVDFTKCQQFEYKFVSVNGDQQVWEKNGNRTWKTGDSCVLQHTFGVL